MDENIKHTVEQYMGAVGEPSPEERAEWKLPHSKFAKFEEGKVGVIGDRELEAAIDSLWKDNAIQGFEKLSLLRIAFEERQRLAQQTHPVGIEEKQRREYQIQYYRRHARIVVHNRELLSQYRSLSEELQALTVTVPMDAAALQSLEEHSGALSETLHSLVALQQYGLLLTKKAEGKTVPPEALERALRELPEHVRGRKDGREVTVPLSRAAPSDAQRKEGVAVLNERLEWLLSYRHGVPGVREEFAMRNPVDIFYAQYLNAADRAIMDEEIRQRLQVLPSAEGQRRVQAMRGARERIAKLREAYRKESGDMHLTGLSEVSVGFFDREYAQESQRAPFDLRAFVKENAQSRGESERYKNLYLTEFRLHKSEVVGGVHPATGERLKGVFEVSLLDMDDWRLYSEDAYKKHARFKIVYPFLDTLVRIQAAPKVIASWLNPLNKIPGVDRTPLKEIPLFTKTTFREEAEAHMRYLREAWKLPATVRIEGKEVPFNFYNLAHWDALSEEQWAAIRESMESTKDILEQRRQALLQPLERYDEDLSSLDALWKIKHPDELVGVMPNERFFGRLTKGEVTVEQILRDPALRAEVQADNAKLSAVWFSLFLRMHENWREYLEAGRVTDERFVKKIDRDLATARKMAEGKPEGWPWWATALGVWYLSAIPRTQSTLRGSLWKVMTRPGTTLSGRVPWRMVKDAWWAGRTGIQGAARLDRAMDGALASSRTMRILGPLGIAAVAIDTGRAILLDARLKKIPDYEATVAALEFLGRSGNEKAPRYRKEMQILRDKITVLQMQQNLDTLLTALKKRGAADARVEPVQRRCTELRKFAAFHLRDLQARFPVTDYLRTDPWGREGNVGVDVARIDHARLRGVQYEKEQETYASMRTFAHPPKLSEALQEDLTRLKDFKGAYDRLLEDAAEALER